jgi:hypothetical protein
MEIIEQKLTVHPKYSAFWLILSVYLADIRCHICDDLLINCLVMMNATSSCQVHRFDTRLTGYLMRCEVKHVCSPTRTHLVSILSVFFAITKSVLSVAVI